MTDKELRKLTRAELLEMLLIQTQEVERLQAELEQISQQLGKRDLDKEKAGNIAEAALQVSGIFEAAQTAADQYLENIAVLQQKTQEKCNWMEHQTKLKCERYIRQAELEAKQFWLQIREDIKNPYIEHERWLQIHSALTGKIYEKVEF